LKFSSWLVKQKKGERFAQFLSPYEKLKSLKANRPTVVHYFIVTESNMLIQPTKKAAVCQFS